MKIEVYKDTIDNWNDAYTLVGTYQRLVRVSLIQNDTAKSYQVCVWGNADFGMERYFTEAEDALEAFRIITGLTTVGISALRKLGFTIVN